MKFLRTLYPNYITEDGKVSVFLFIYFLCGVIFGFLNIFFSVFPIFLFGLFPVLFLVYFGKDKQRIFLGSWAFGFGLIGVAILWFWEALPLTWLGVHNVFLGALLVFISWGTVTLALSFSVGVIIYLFFLTKKNKALDLFLFSGFWILGEYARAWFFALLMLGGSSLLAPNFSFGFLGYVFAENAIILQLAQWGGVYTLSALFAALSWLIFYASFLKKIHWIRIMATLIISSIMLWGASLLISSKVFSKEAYSQSAQSRILVALITTDFSPNLFISREAEGQRLALYTTFLERIKNNESGQSPNMVIFPEDSRFFHLLSQSGHNPLDYLNRFFPEDVLLIDSGRTEDQNKIFSRLYYISLKQGILEKQDKLFLVPQGEYTPYLYRFIFNLLGQARTLEQLKYNREYSKGESAKVITFDGITLATYFCSEIMSPYLYKDLKSKEPDIIINLASHAWFHHSNILNRHALMMAKVRAVETASYFIRAGNGTPSFVLDPYGNVLNIRKETGILYAEIPK